MEKQRLTYLLQQHLAGSLSAEEQQELSMLLQADADRELFNTVLADLMQQETPAVPANPAVWQQMVQDIVAIDRPSATPVKTIARRTLPIYRWAAAAAVLLLISTVVYFFINRQGPDITSVQKNIPSLALTPVAKSMLTLPDGTQLMLDEAKNGTIATLGTVTITKQDNRITYTGAGAADTSSYHVISTARGSEYEVVLSDGSQVWLNAASSFRFPTAFANAARIVDLSGQAWFDVQHAAQHPFLVHSGSFTTSVLGTAFDIKDYPGEKSKIVSVQRGKVKVATADTTLAILEKGQQVKLIADTVVHRQAVDTALIAGWKQGDLIYDDEALETVVADLQRVFKDSVTIRNNTFKKARVTLRLEKKTGMQRALELLCALMEVRLSKKDGIYIIE
jgi:ferric-dicitrate binding protein FerR (iron transport regulator)